jgi:chromosome segregation ATPase
MAELKRASDRSKILEGEHASLQKRFKEQEAKIANIERASQTARQGMAQAQQRASEWEKRTKELEAELDATRSRLDDADEAKLQLDSDLSLMKMHMEEKDAAERAAKVC